MIFGTKFSYNTIYADRKITGIITRNACDGKVWVIFDYDKDRKEKLMLSKFLTMET